MGDPFQPRAGVDYPRTFQEFDEWFATEAGCRDYLVRLRWPTGFRSRTVMREMNRGLRHATAYVARAVEGGFNHGGNLVCRDTQVIASVDLVCDGVRSAGPARWGCNACLGLGSYQTAWTWLHKMRRAMVFAGRDRLSGAVQVDETFIGAPEEEVHGRETEHKAIVVVAVEKRGRAMGRIRLQRIQDASAGQIIPFIQKSISERASIITDGWRGYAGLKSLGYEHTIRNIKRSGVPAHELLPRIHRVASLLKRWFLGTLQGGVQRRHLDYIWTNSRFASIVVRLGHADYSSTA